MKIADDTTFIRKLDRQDGAIAALAWSPDGRRIAVAGGAAEVNVYDAGDRRAGSGVQGTQGGNLYRGVQPGQQRGRQPAGSTAWCGSTTPPRAN